MTWKPPIIYVLLFLLMAPLGGYTQHAKIDSLYKTLSLTEDPAKSLVYLQLAKALMYVNIRKVPSLLDSAYYFSNISDSDSLKAMILQTKGIERWINGYYPQSRSILTKAANFHLEVSDSLNLAQDYHYIGLNFLYDATHDSALIFLEKALAINRLTNQKSEVVENLDHIAVVYRQLGDYHNVLKYSTEAQDARNAIKGYSNTTKYYSHGGRVFNQKAFEEAIRYHKKVLDEVDATDKEKLGLSINNIGSTFMNAGLYDSAIYYYRQSARLIGESTGGNSYAGQLNELGEALFANQQYAEAEKVFNQSKYLWDSVGTRISKSIIQYNLARTYLALGNMEVGFPLVNEVKALAASMSKNAFYCKICLVKARYLMKLGNAESAMQEAILALENAQRLMLKEIIINSYQVMKEISLMRKDHNAALGYMEKYTEMKDSLYNDRTSIQLAEMQVAYEMEKKNQTIDALNAQFELKEIQLNQRNFIIILSLSILMISIFFTIKRYRYVNKLSAQNAQIESQRHSLELANKEKEFMLYEIHHRVKNNLQMIISMLNIQSNKTKNEYAREELEKNKDRLFAMAMIHQQLYEGHMLKETINIEEYLHSLLKQLLSTQKNSEIAHSTEIEPIHVTYDTAIAIGLIVNELVSNSIKHAFPNVTSPHLEVTLKQANDLYLLKVKDNGNTCMVMNEEGFGIRLISSFVQELDGSMNMYFDKGTIAEVSFQDPSPTT